MIRVIVIGAGGHGQVVADALQAASDAGAAATPVGFVDDAALAGSSILGLPILGTTAELTSLEFDAVVVAIGGNATRRTLSLKLRERGIPFASAVHPAATIARNVELGAGAMVCAGVVVNTGAVIGDGVILNTACSVDHDSRIGHFAHIAPGVHLAGEVRVGEGALVGIGSAVTPGRTIGSWAIVGAGSVVTRDIGDREKVAGVPARRMRQAVEGGLS
jgi:sugar O-acyltransferase (sialic acid O-acetyltransferase NeuD family)